MADNMTLDEALEAASADADATDFCIIDPETRKIDIPDSCKILGVESDEEVERLYFKCPKIVGDDVDISALSLRINFRNANDELDRYVVTDSLEDGDYVTFSWVLSRKVTAYKGTVGFVVCAVSIQDDGTVKNEWNTALNTDCYVLEGLEVTEEVLEESDPEVVEWIVANFEAVIEAGKTAEAAAEAAEAAEEAMKKVVASAEDVESDINKAVTAANEAAEAANKSAQDANSAEEERVANENARIEAEKERESASATAVQNCKDATAALIEAENRIAFELDSSDNGLNIIIYEEVA